MRNLFDKLLQVVRRWNEGWIPILGLIFWHPFISFLRWVDPTSAPLDAGYLHTIPFSFMCFGCISLFVWLGLRFNFKTVWEFWENEFDKVFNTLEPWQKIKFSLCLFSLLLLSVVAVFVAVISGAA